MDGATMRELGGFSRTATENIISDCGLQIVDVRCAAEFGVHSRSSKNHAYRHMMFLSALNANFVDDERE